MFLNLAYLIFLALAIDWLLFARIANVLHPAFWMGRLSLFLYHRYQKLEGNFLVGRASSASSGKSSSASSGKSSSHGKLWRRSFSVIFVIGNHVLIQLSFFGFWLVMRRLFLQPLEGKVLFF